MQESYKFENQYVFANRISAFTDNSIMNDEGDLEIGKVIFGFITSYNSHNQKKIIHYLNKISSVSEKYDICNHPDFISNSICQMIISLFSKSVSFPIIHSASLAITSFSYLFSKYPNNNSPFNRDILFHILQPETISFIFDFIRENYVKEISVFTKMLRVYCTFSEKFRDILISEVPIEIICEIIEHGIQSNAKDEWKMSLISLICDICLYPLKISQIASILTLFDSFNILSPQLDVVFIIIHTIRYLIENNEISNHPNSVQTENLDHNQNVVHLVLDSSILPLFDQLLEQLKMNRTFNENQYREYFDKIEDDICGITISIYFLTEKQILIIPIQRILGFLQSDENSIIYNSLTFFSTYVNESKENYDYCSSFLFDKFANFLQFKSAKIRIHAGHVLYSLIEKANGNVLKNSLYQHILVFSFNLIQFNDTKLSIEMLFVMQTFIQFAINTNDIKIASLLNDNILNYNILEQLNSLVYDYDDSDDDEELNDFSQAAYLTLDLIKIFISKYDFTKFYINQNLMEDQNLEEDQNLMEDQNDTGINIFDVDNLDFADQYFKNTKPNGFI